jgi:glycogen operon protein
MKTEDWENGGWMRTLGMFLAGDAPEIRDHEGRRALDDDFLILLNGHHDPVEFRVPGVRPRSVWKLVFDTARPELDENKEKVGSRQVLKLEAHSFVLLGHKRQAPRGIEPAKQPG